MTRTRQKNWEANIPRWFSAIYSLVLDSGVRFVAYDLPKKFAGARIARDFAEHWSPNAYFVGLIAPLEVCERKFVEQKLGRYLERTRQTGDLRAA